MPVTPFDKTLESLLNHLDNCAGLTSELCRTPYIYVQHFPRPPPLNTRIRWRTSELDRLFSTSISVKLIFIIIRTTFVSAIRAVQLHYGSKAEDAEALVCPLVGSFHCRRHYIHSSITAHRRVWEKLGMKENSNQAKCTQKGTEPPETHFTSSFPYA